MSEPQKSIDVGDLAEVVTASVQRALRERTGENALFVRPPRIIVGIIFDPEPSPWFESGAAGGQAE